MKAMLIFGNERTEAVPGSAIEDAVRTAGKLPDTYLYLRNGRPVPMTTVLNDGDVIEAVRVASGG